jgi:hypothetical protein
MFLHVISLEYNKYFLHYSNKDSLLNSSKILFECELMYEFVQINKPKFILESTIISQNFEIDFFVKKYMHFYGIDNVRGGSYSSVILDENTKRFIQNEFKTKIQTYEKKDLIIENILLEYKDINDWSLSKLIKEYDDIVKIEEKYNKESLHLHNLKFGNGITEINRDFLLDLKWLCNQIARVFANREVTENLIKKYEIIIKKMKSLYYIFLNYTSDIEDTYNHKIHLYSPEVLLDNIFFHSNIIKYNNSEVIEKFIDYFEYMYYCVINRIDEYTFDVKSYPDHFKEITKYKKYYVNKLLLR